MKTKFTILLFSLLSFQIGKSQFTVNIPFSGITTCVGIEIAIPYSTSGVAISWQWDFGDGITSTLENPTHLYSSPGTYIVTLVASDGVNTDDDNCTVVVNPTPIVDFTYTISGNSVQFTDQSSAGSSQWNWNFGNGTTSQIENPSTTYLYPPDSCYDVTLIVTNLDFCTDSLTKNDYICINSTTSINEIKNNSISIYPSPITNNQKLTVKVKGLEKIVVYDVLGSLIQLPTISKNENEIIFETNQLNKGIYFLQIHFDDKTAFTKKIVVQ